MNRNQQLAFFIGIITMLIYACFPPWVYIHPDSISQFQIQAGRHFVLNPPTAKYLPTQDHPVLTLTEAQINVVRLLLEELFGAAVISSLVILMRNKQTLRYRQ
jgi:hypothetical protein